MQPANNYAYDKIGNLTGDAQSNVHQVDWTVYGKIRDMLNPNGHLIYAYDPAGQRASKTLGTLTTFYVRDASGNPLAVYDNNGGAINWKEQHLYGSSRLGMWQPNMALSANNAGTIWATTGHKQYELTNHLGNVIATIAADQRNTVQNGTNPIYYTPQIQTAQDYYAFGGEMPGRVYNNANYRYGFNGKENDNEVKGTGNQQDYGARIYDPRVGRFLSVDPIGNEYPWNSTYAFAEDRVIDGTDLDGKEFRKAAGIFFDTGIEYNPKLGIENSSISTVLRPQKLPGYFKMMKVNDMEGLNTQMENIENQVAIIDPEDKELDKKEPVKDAKDGLAGLIVKQIMEKSPQIKGFEEVKEQIADFNSSTAIVNSASKSGLLPKQFKNSDEFKADLTNFIFDGTLASGTGTKAKAYNALISALGKELFLNKDGVLKGNYKRPGSSTITSTLKWGLDQPPLVNPIITTTAGQDGFQKLIDNYNNATDGCVNCTTIGKQ